LNGERDLIAKHLRVGDIIKWYAMGKPRYETITSITKHGKLDVLSLTVNMDGEEFFWNMGIDSDVMIIPRHIVEWRKKIARV
jgi:hypothetical protein